MISRKATHLMLGVATLLAAALVMLTALRLFQVFGWAEYSIVLAIVVLVIVAGYSRARRRAEETANIKSARASLQKDLWEKRHKREW
jgi:hypothetical protein